MIGGPVEWLEDDARAQNDQGRQVANAAAPGMGRVGARHLAVAVPREGAVMSRRDLSGSRGRRVMVPLLPLLAALAASLAYADEAADTGSDRRIVYVPPDPGEPPTRTLAAVGGPGEPAPLHVLAPEQTGLTLEDQPKLYWYLGAPSDTRLEVTLNDSASAKPLLQADLGRITRPGVHATDLADFGLKLEPGVEYQWSVAEVPDPEQGTISRVASATIARVPPQTGLRAEFEGATPLERLAALAADGYWYDVIGLLSAEIAEQPEDPELRRLRAELLDQVGLGEVAAYDRAAVEAQ